jgi:hypothetical protein
VPVAVAVNGTAVANWQYGAGFTTAGASGVGVIVTISGVLGPSQPPSATDVT